MNLRSTLFAIGTLLIHDAAVEGRRIVRTPLVDPNCECGDSGEGVSNRIVGGEISTPNIFPWMVAIFNKGALHCGGTLINDRYILTAGHCVKWTNPADMTIGFGIHDIENVKDAYIVPLEKVILHEGFVSDYLHDTNDLALIKLKYPVKYSENVRPACLPKKESNYAGHRVKVTGWGRVTTGGGASRFLRQAELKVMPWQSCRNTSLGDHLTKSMMCAYAENTDACQGDSGGPLMYRNPDGKYQTIGVVSWGIGCAKRGMPGVYVKNTDYLDWILSNTADAVYCLNN